MTEWIGAIATVLAVGGVLLNNHRIIWCFALWGVSNSLSAGLHHNAGMSWLTARDVIFLGLAAHGAWKWSRTPTRPPSVPQAAERGMSGYSDALEISEAHRAAQEQSNEEA